MSVATESTSVVLRAPEPKHPHCALFHASLIKKKKKSRHFDMRRTIPACSSNLSLRGRGCLKPHRSYGAPGPCCDGPSHSCRSKQQRRQAQIRLNAASTHVRSGIYSIHLGLNEQQQRGSFSFAARLYQRMLKFSCF